MSPRRRPDSGGHNRWSLAAALDAVLPQIRGRDRLLNVVRGRTPPRALRSDTLVRWGPGLEATINPSLDGSLRSLYMTQWVQPTLIPILEICLTEGDLFVDVGANIGVYSTWAAKLVGPSGVVLAVEPVPRTRAWLEQICADNGLDQVEVVSTAVGDEEGWTWMKTTEGAAGLSNIGGLPGSDLKVPITTLDSLIANRVPALIKIDVEGYELSVMNGARNILERYRIPVVFEAPDFGGGDGTTDCVNLLEAIGYHIFSLTSRGLQPFTGAGYSHNLFAVYRGDQKVLQGLKAARFPRNQNT